MTDVAAMLNAYPGERPQVDEDTLVICIQEALNCAQACASCADACSADPSAAYLAHCAGAAPNGAGVGAPAAGSRPVSDDDRAVVAVFPDLDAAQATGRTARGRRGREHRRPAPRRIPRTRSTEWKATPCTSR
jgi:hypothetical protein